ncbi:MAG: hypothetical protein JNM88_15165 [Chitinophagaceae bacterium]|nr:hypothetical protein [Chitinophagaceae bacterium]
MRNHLILLLITGFYAFLYIATSRAPVCDDECMKVANVYQKLHAKYSSITSVYRCGGQPGHKIICVLVNVQRPVAMDRLADTVCQLLSEEGLQNRQLHILKNGNYPYDTLITRTCN